MAGLPNGFRVLRHAELAPHSQLPFLLRKVGIVPKERSFPVTALSKETTSVSVASLLWSFFSPLASCPSTPRPRHSPLLDQRFRPEVERLESRLVPYALSGNQWANPNVLFSFVPDGTTWMATPSQLSVKLDAVTDTATWQREFARALQTWADVSTLNFRLVGD